MKYYRLINPNFNSIISQAEGKLVSEKIGNEKCIAVFTNYILKTYEGTQVNVFAVLQILNETTDKGPIYFLCTEINPNDLQTKLLTDICSVFFVGASGRVYDEELEKALLFRCEILRGKFIEEYKANPGYPMFYNERQRNFILSLREE